MRTYERNGVHVDQCGDCRGIFLDRGELERLIDAENAWHGGGTPQAAPAAEGRYRSDHDRDEDRYRDQQRAASSGGLGAVVSEVLGQVQGRSHSSSSHGSYGQPYKKKRKESFLSDLFG
ncbi:zf-TFIIB domain-containing protein [Blastococcus sp. TF02A-26]|uniref:TFIIB-type zinc ribbon-containing protein n=1 Tax=Blastococcus sp. TF02A-26 TaxID=2250577 RepID=UPI001F2189D0